MKTIDMLELTFLNSLEERTISQEARRLELKSIINACPDYFVKEALTMRYDHGNYKYIPFWFIIAIKLNTTEDQLKKACNRYLEDK